MDQDTKRPRRSAGEGAIYETADGRLRGSVLVDFPDGRQKRVYVSGRTRADVVRKLDAKRPRSASDKVLRSTTTPSSGLSPLSIPSGLNYSNMVNYALAHWGGAGAPYNGDYRNWSSNGGDCTNFVSQALRAGWLARCYRSVVR